jgi:hypothetical protein
MASQQEINDAVRRRKAHGAIDGPNQSSSPYYNQGNCRIDNDLYIKDGFVLVNAYLAIADSLNGRAEQ